MSSYELRLGNYVLRPICVSLLSLLLVSPIHLTKKKSAYLFADVVVLCVLQATPEEAADDIKEEAPKQVSLVTK